MPNDIELLAKCRPIYIEFPGWKTPTNSARKWKALPPRARTYLMALADLTGAKLSIVSVGPGREEKRPTLSFSRPRMGISNFPPRC